MAFELWGHFGHLLSWSRSAYRFPLSLRRSVWMRWRWTAACKAHLKRLLPELGMARIPTDASELRDIVSGPPDPVVVPYAVGDAAPHEALDDPHLLLHGKALLGDGLV